MAIGDPFLFNVCPFPEKEEITVRKVNPRSLPSLRIWVPLVSQN